MDIPIETAVRVCPAEFSDNDVMCVQSNPLNNTIQLSNNQIYPVNYALPNNCCQNTLYTTVVMPMVNFLLEGCDVSIVTLGQSGTGKTYTLFGHGFHFASSEAEHGVIPRFIREVFTKIKQYRDRNYVISITWSQICGDNVQDLIGGGSVECADILDVFQLIQLGMSNIAPKGTHTLFTLTLEQQWVIDSTIHHRVSTASFADLAGCEKMIMYDNNGLVQTIPVDPGLHALQRCILTLSQPYINNINITHNLYAQSVLTTLLKDSFGGRAKTIVICCVSPMMQDFSESLYSLQLAIRCQLVRNFVTVNSYTTYETVQENLDIFGLQFAANQLLKLVSNAEELFQSLVMNGALSKNEMEQVSQWLTLKQECQECLSENSEPHRSLERIEEEIEDSTESTSENDDSISEEESQTILDKLDTFMDNFRSCTNALVSKANIETNNIISATKDSINSSTSYHSKGARCRRGSIHCLEDMTSVSLSVKLSGDEDILENEEKNPDTHLSYDMKKKMVKQFNTAIQGCQKQITELEQTIKVKQNLMQQLLKHKDTKSNAHDKLELQYQRLKKDHDIIKDKLSQAHSQRSHSSQENYRKELEGKLFYPILLLLQLCKPVCTTWDILVCLQYRYGS